MKPHQEQFLALVLARRALGFGQFTLKSGRVSPYFFNAGHLHRGEDLLVLGRCYAQTIIEASLGVDGLFGPAYKGIPLVAATAMGLAELGLDLPWSFNRKETKNHGEGGDVVGAPLEGRILVVDDVITAGTAIAESAACIRRHGAELAGVAVALDRQERIGDAHDAPSAVEEVGRRFGIPVAAIANLDQLLTYLKAHPKAMEAPPLAALADYRRRYGVVA
ncbi:MAG: orotate phosphoribosyltransferase [Candidatus Competibacterales bacterium]